MRCRSLCKSHPERPLSTTELKELTAIIGATIIPFSYFACLARVIYNVAHGRDTKTFRQAPH